eukprot:scaffold17443_cov38-Cyclotella_meneghiniana.AAC.2
MRDTWARATAATHWDGSSTNEPMMNDDNITSCGSDAPAERSSIRESVVVGGGAHHHPLLM